MPEFAKRRIGRTALEVTVLGLGCATLGGSRVDVTRATAEAIVGAAWAAGVRYVDTAPYYGLGQAERCVGDALREMPRDDWVLSTKVGRLLRPRGATESHWPRRHCSFRWRIRRWRRSSQARATPMNSAPIWTCSGTRYRRHCGRICVRRGCSIPR